MGDMWTLLPPMKPQTYALDDAQSVVAQPASGVTCALGGPGTGKSATLVEAVVQRVKAGAPLSEIAVLAGSRQAAQDLRRKVVGRIARAQTQPLFTTVHGLALGLMRQATPADALPWALLRAPEQEERIRELLSHGRASWPEQLQPALETRGFARQLRELLARIRQRSWDEHDVARLAQERGDAELAAVADFLDEYLAVGDLEQTIDYAELVFRTRVLLSDPGAAEMVCAQIREIFVDDAHDLDPAQTALLGDFAHLGIPVTVFGDPDQVVSGFRGASARGMLALLDVEPSRSIALVHDHRHSGAVSAALANLRRHITTVTARPACDAVGDEEGAVSVAVYDSVAAEAAHVADGLRRAVADGAQWSELAVIVRAGRSQLMPLTRALLQLGIPVEVAADELVLSDNEAVGALLSAISLAASDADPTDEEARSLLLSPLVGLDAVSVRRFERYVEGSTIWEKMCATEPGGEWAVVKQVADALVEVSDALADGGSVGEALWALWDSTEWPTHLRQAALRGDRYANHQLDATVELFERAGREPILSGAAGVRIFVRDLEGEEIPADTGRESKVTGTGALIITAHRAKGREWKHVWVVGVQEGRWPQGAPGGQILDAGRLLDGQPRMVSEHLQEERRLFYLACARASTYLHVSAVAAEDLQPSRFLRELGVTPVEVIGYPEQPLTSSGLVGALRAAVADPESSGQLRRGAALRLHQLAQQGIDAANPSNWWGPPPAAMEPNTAMVRLSGSMLREILDCPRRYYLERRARAQRPSPVAASFGSLIHSVAQRAQIDGLDADGMRAMVAEQWDDVEFAAPWQEAHAKALSDEIIDRLAAWIPSHRDTLLSVEHGFEVPVEVAGREVLLHGFVDRIDLLHTSDGPALRIIDFKTMKSKPKAKEVASNVQLGLYQLAAESGAFDALAPGVRKVAAAALVLLRFDASGLPAVMEQSSLAAIPELPEEPLKVGPTWMHERIAAALDVLESGEFPATPGDACRTCDFRAGCPKFQENA